MDKANEAEIYKRALNDVIERAAYMMMGPGSMQLLRRVSAELYDAKYGEQGVECTLTREDVRALISFVPAERVQQIRNTFFKQNPGLKRALDYFDEQEKLKKASEPPPREYYVEAGPFHGPERAHYVRALGNEYPMLTQELPLALLFATESTAQASMVSHRGKPGYAGLREWRIRRLGDEAAVQRGDELRKQKNDDYAIGPWICALIELSGAAATNCLTMKQQLVLEANSTPRGRLLAEGMEISSILRDLFTVFADFTWHDRGRGLSRTAVDAAKEMLTETEEALKPSVLNDAFIVHVPGGWILKELCSARSGGPAWTHHIDQALLFTTEALARQMVGPHRGTQAFKGWAVCTLGELKEKRAKQERELRGAAVGVHTQGGKVLAMPAPIESDDEPTTPKPKKWPKQAGMPERKKSKKAKSK